MPADPPVRVRPLSLNGQDLYTDQRPPLGSAVATGLVERCGFFRTHGRLHVPAPNGTFVEVIRARCRQEARVFRKSLWYYAAVGTGIWLNVGRTLVIHGREIPLLWPLQSRFVNQFSAEYDTLQLVSLYSANLREIVDLRRGRTPQRVVVRTCPADADGPTLRSGWSASAPCLCANTAHYLNCRRPVRPPVKA
jgi:hypothetical protein